MAVEYYHHDLIDGDLENKKKNISSCGKTTNFDQYRSRRGRLISRECALDSSLCSTLFAIVYVYIFI